MTENKGKPRPVPTYRLLEEWAKREQERPALLRKASLGVGDLWVKEIEGRWVKMEKTYTEALEALEKITAVTSGSYSAAVDLKDTMVTKLPAEDYRRIEPEVQGVVTYGKKATEEIPVLAESMRQSLDLMVAEAAESSRIASRNLRVAIIVGVLTLMVALGWIG